MTILEQIEKKRLELDMSKEQLSLAMGYNRKYWGCVSTNNGGIFTSEAACEIIDYLKLEVVDNNARGDDSKTIINIDNL